MSTPVATIADALIAFILNLLRDPDAVEEFNAAPTQVMAAKGLADACAADVQAVKPVIVDHPNVTPLPPGPPNPPEPPDEVIKEITRIINQFTTIDNRTTLVDQSTNQNIWTDGGDVTQIFDQEAVIASGDDSMAAGDDVTSVDSDVDVTIGDIAIGNTDTDIEGSFNDTNTNTEGDGEADAPMAAVADAAATDPAADPVADALAADPTGVAGVVGDAVGGAVDLALDAAAPEAPVAESVPAPEPFVEEAAMPADTYEADDAAMAGVDDAPFEEPLEED
jgi:hypothetical protein